LQSGSFDKLSCQSGVALVVFVIAGSRIKLLLYEALEVAAPGASIRT